MDKARIGVILQGELPSGETVDRTRTGEYALVCVLTDDGIDLSSFGSLDTMQAAFIINSLESYIADLEEKYPLAAVFSTLASIGKGLAEEEEDG